MNYPKVKNDLSLYTCIYNGNSLKEIETII